MSGRNAAPASVCKRVENKPSQELELPLKTVMLSFSHVIWRGVAGVRHWALGNRLVGDEDARRVGSRKDEPRGSGCGGE